MTASIREQILERVQVLLVAAALPGVAVGSVMRSRETAVTRSMTPAIVIMAGDTETRRIATNVDRHVFECNVEYFVRGDPWTTLVDPVDVAGHAAIMSDAPLAALVARIERTGETTESLEANATAGTLTVHYRCTYLTAAQDISRAA